MVVHPIADILKEIVSAKSIGQSVGKLFDVVTLHYVAILEIGFFLGLQSWKNGVWILINLLR